VRTTPSLPRSWAHFSLLSLHSHRNVWAYLRLLGQPNALLALGRGSPQASAAAPAWAQKMDRLAGADGSSEEEDAPPPQAAGARKPSWRIESELSGLEHTANRICCVTEQVLDAFIGPGRLPSLSLCAFPPTSSSCYACLSLCLPLSLSSTLPRSPSLSPSLTLSAFLSVSLSASGGGGGSHTPRRVNTMMKLLH
jgi:hypothetical protein